MVRRNKSGKLKREHVMTLRNGSHGNTSSSNGSKASPVATRSKAKKSSMVQIISNRVTANINTTFSNNNNATTTTTTTTTTNGMSGNENSPSIFTTANINNNNTTATAATKTTTTKTNTTMSKTEKNRLKQQRKRRNKRRLEQKEPTPQDLQLNSRDIILKKRAKRERKKKARQEKKEQAKETKKKKKKKEDSKNKCVMNGSSRTTIYTQNGTTSSSTSSTNGRGTKRKRQDDSHFRSNNNRSNKPNYLKSRKQFTLRLPHDPYWDTNQDKSIASSQHLKSKLKQSRSTKRGGFFRRMNNRRSSTSSNDQHDINEDMMQRVSLQISLPRVSWEGIPWLDWSTSSNNDTDNDATNNATGVGGGNDTLNSKQEEEMKEEASLKDKEEDEEVVGWCLDRTGTSIQENQDDDEQDEKILAETTTANTAETSDTTDTTTSQTQQSSSSSNKLPTASKPKPQILPKEYYTIPQSTIESFNKELRQFESYVKLTPREIAARKHVVDQIYNVTSCLFHQEDNEDDYVKDYYKHLNKKKRFQTATFQNDDYKGRNNVRVQQFGSFATLNVCTFTSDVDLALWGVVPSSTSSSGSEMENEVGKRVNRHWKFDNSDSEDEENVHEGGNGFINLCSSSDNDDDDDDKNQKMPAVHASTTSSSSLLILGSEEEDDDAEAINDDDDDDNDDDGKDEKKVSKTSSTNTATTRTNSPPVPPSSGTTTIATGTDTTGSTTTTTTNNTTPTAKTTSTKESRLARWREALKNALVDEEEAAYLNQMQPTSGSTSSTCTTSDIHDDDNNNVHNEELNDRDYDSDDDNDDKVNSKERSNDEHGYEKAPKRAKREVDNLEVSIVSKKKSSTKKTTVAGLYNKSMTQYQSPDMDPNTRRAVVTSLNTLERKMKQHPLVGMTEVRKKAKVPILNFNTLYGFETDVALGGHNGTDTSAYVSKKVEKYDSFATVIILLKILLFQTDLDKPFTGGIGSYRLYVMLAYHYEIHLKLGGTDSPAEILMSFLFRFHRNGDLDTITEQLRRDDALQNVCTFVCRENILRCSEGGETDFWAVSRMNECCCLFSICFSRLMNRLQKNQISLENAENDYDDDANNDDAPLFLASIIDTTKLRSLRSKCIDMVEKQVTNQVARTYS